MTIFGDMATRQQARRTQPNKCIKTNGQIVFWALALDSLLAAPAATTAVWLRVIRIWRVEASPCSRAESVKPAGLKTSILDEGRKKKKKEGSGNHFLPGVYIQSWCCSLDGVQTQAGVMGIRTPWPDTPGTELVTDEDLMLFFFFPPPPYFLFFSNWECISLQWFISPPAYPCNSGWIEGYSMQISELSKTQTRLGRHACS